MQIMRSKYNIHMPVRFFYLFNYMRLLHHASGYGYNAFVITFGRFQHAKMAVYFLLGVFTHTAGFKNNDIGRLTFAYLYIPHLFEHSGKLLGIVLIHLASENPDIIFELFFVNRCFFGIYMFYFFDI